MHEHDEFDEDRPKSKTRVKQEMHELQDLGRQLTEMGKAQLAEVPLDDDLREAINTLHRIKSNEARRRQMQYIGKLMRGADSEAIEAALARFHERDQQHSRFDHMAEDWRQRLLEGGKQAQSEFFDRYPGADHQHLRQLVRDSLREIEKQKPPTNRRKLFRYLRDFFMQEL
ncbi:ribosome biogenesis factor YjgA [Microbulbifer yueqingensis]|uniref:Dual-action ribosomal maturation protein DarP n=1 Tax=Microbulbifer yueqingensis TaxID=658219 RepID=A0A1G8VIZ1_9GAMM|nr:ribosome biogenesis factor YjgA [Microbulbifer yueqingensis]SDJ65884.1 ribosome-associated protein [Microbulbifer yueqingensis]